MRSTGLLQFAILFLLSAVVIADTPLIRTTSSDSSNVSFIARTPLSWETVEHDSLWYIRFTDTPVTDSIGYPELPMITCLVAIPDNVTPHIEFTFSDVVTENILPVYPAPAQILVSDNCTPSVVDSFAQDSTEYTSASFWPSERVRLIGKTRICDQRLLQIQLFPAQYRASDSTLSTVSSFSVSVSFDSSEAVWSNIGLGMFQEMIEGSPIVGYKPIGRTHAPVPEYFEVVNPWTGPAYPDNRMPDYLIICATGLYEQCSEAIDALAEHRVSLNSFDVATVLTDDILLYFKKEPGQTVITDETIRDFTEHMWENWPQASVKTPDYLLLIGDHEDPEYGDEDWFLPTHIYDDYLGETLIEDIGNDEWYAYMNGDTEIDNDFPSMVVGRISVKNGSTTETDTLSAMIENIIALEQPIVNAPLVDNRRSILRLAGTGTADEGDTALKVYYSWGPSRLWTGEFSSWLGYEYNSYYCGDGRDFTSSDGSVLASSEFRDICIDELKTGAGVAFYTNHGELHMFSAGLEWWPEYAYPEVTTKGARDSTFNNYQIENQLTCTHQYYSAPFQLHLCCSSGTFNHTLADHQGRTSHRYFCLREQSPVCDFGTDCLAEKLLKNTAVPVAGIFASSMPSCIYSYPVYGK